MENDSRCMASCWQLQGSRGPTGPSNSWVALRCKQGLVIEQGGATQVQLIAHNRKREQIALEQGIPTSRLSLRRPEGLVPGRRKRRSPLMVSLCARCCRAAAKKEDEALPSSQ